MGRLKPRLDVSRAQIRRVAIGWSLPVFLAVLILVGVNSRVQADPAPTAAELQEYLQTKELHVFTYIAHDYPQIYYLFNDQAVELSSSNYTHLHPMASGQYITWQGVVDGAGQVFLYDILSQSLIQLSVISPSEAPFVHNNTVTWQTWDGSHWQIYYYNGFQVQKITDGQDSSSVNSSTDGEQIIYAEQFGPDEWKAQSYDISSREVTTIREGDTASTAYPKFNKDGSIETAFIAH